MLSPSRIYRLPVYRVADLKRYARAFFTYNVFVLFVTFSSDRRETAPLRFSYKISMLQLSSTVDNNTSKLLKAIAIKRKSFRFSFIQNGITLYRFFYLSIIPPLPSSQRFFRRSFQLKIFFRYKDESFPHVRSSLITYV